MDEPRKIWWARPRKLCALERPGGGGRSHRRERREVEIAWLCAHGVRLVISVMPTRHNLPDYERAGLEHRHVPVGSADDAPAAAVEELLALLRKELRSRGAVAIHGDHATDFVAAVCAAHLHETRGVDPSAALEKAAAAGLEISHEARELAGAAAEA